GEGAVAHRHRPAVVDAAAPGAATGVAGEGAVAHRQRPDVDDAAAAAGCGVAGEGAVPHRHRPAPVVGQAASGDGGVSGEHAVADGQRPEVVDAAAGAGVAPGDRQAGQGHLLAGLDLEDAGEVAAADGQLVGPGAVDLHVVGEVEFAAGQGD